ncbi:MAG TPA: mandelate racemase/muconate lactonizing enzyme family protein [Bryobacteraceae bacterium]|nr:mandelate racemase/muconate lactonizing enzyme family protein [Bryobacteraceae bacterium]
MRIVDVETYLVGNPWKNWLFLKLITDEGIHGIGEGSLGHLSKTVETAVHEMKPFILGLEVFQTELLVNRLSRQVYADGGQIKMCAISALEIACWDAIGKALRQPIHNLVGGRCRERVRAYGNGWYRCKREPRAFANAARRAVALGYTALKFDPFGAGMNILAASEEHLSLDIVGAVRDAVGPDVDLAIEAHSRFTVSSAIRIGRKLEQFSPAWFEEPVPHNNIQAIVDVSRHLNIPVATGESFSSKQQIAELMAYNEIDIVNFEPLHMGGILGSRKVADMVEAHYGVVIPHAAQGPVCTLACLHIDAATPNAWLQETFEDWNEPWERDLLTYFPAIVDGHFEIPTGPGLGADLNLEEVRKHPYHENLDTSLFEEDWQFRRSAVETS